MTLMRFRNHSLRFLPGEEGGRRNAYLSPTRAKERERTMTLKPGRMARPWGMLAPFAFALVAGCRAGSPPPSTPGGSAPADAVASRVPPPPPIAAPKGTFLVKPYLQLGNSPAGAGGRERATILWQTADQSGRWSVEVGDPRGEGWRAAAPPSPRRVALPGVAPYVAWTALADDLAPGAEFDYRVKRDGVPVFAARGRARKGSGQPHRFVVFGDCGAGTPGQKALAYRVFRERPDFVFLTGDIVYDRGLLSEYRAKYFPVYNAETASAGTGAPLLRSTLFLATPGNHDITYNHLGRYPDALAYFLLWSQPLNGPLGAVGAPGTPKLSGPENRRQAFVTAAGPNYPRMANFSFRFGDAHWVVLDANYYVDWTNPALRAWVARELASARDAAWRFVAFHAPGFSSSRKHFDYQKMRLLSPVFEAGGVDVVFSGHVHNYQRTFPLRFTPRRSAGGRWEDRRGRVAGDWVLDEAFDGAQNTRPQGVIYVVTGAGGGGLYDRKQPDDPASWQPFTQRFVADTYSFTVADVEREKLTIQQVSPEGKELDRFVVTR